MIQRRAADRQPGLPAWGDPGPALLLLRTSGPDPAADELLGWTVACPDGEGGYRVLERQVEERSGLHAAWLELQSELAGRPLLCTHGAELERWYDHLEGRPGSAPPCLGLVELTALTRPRRDASRGPAPATAADLARALAARVRAAHELGGEALALVADGLRRAALGLEERDPGAADRLRLAWSVLDRPLAFAPLGSALSDGLLTDALAAGPAEDEDGEDLARFLDAGGPACARGDHEPAEPLPPRAEHEGTFPPEDEQRLDAIFREHLPALFGPGGYRPAQHEVAREVARSLGRRELLLVHAPTGTGKTLAYLVPALLWSLRHEVRVGVATYTRALQEQAMDRDVPRALEALARAGVPGRPRVSMLKGRENYLCWRALRLAGPSTEDDAETWLAWVQLLVFSLTDPEADLDRLPVQPPVPLRASRAWRAARGALVSQVRARSGCCTRREDRGTCGAEQARRRAERSHVVVTNHAFALARQEFLRRVVFDECEHLHDQAHGAFSATLTLREARSVLASIHRPDRPRSRTPLDRLLAQLLPGSPSHDHVRDALEMWDDARLALLGLDEAAREFELWRERVRRARSAGEEHSLLREYLADERRAEGMIAARRALGRALGRLDVALAELSERLDAMPVRGGPRIRRGLELARTELGELAAKVEAWLPLQEGRPALRRETFYDVERDGDGELTLAARVLLPNEYLGRFYYPALEGAVLLSATTWMGGSFDGAIGYLGLDRASQPVTDDEVEREPMPVRTFRAPEAFDYGRVLVCAPRDVPAVNADKGIYLAWLRRFLAWLGERTRGRMLVLFTNSQDVRTTGEALAGFFRARDVPLFWQGMEEAGKEELSARFREHRDSILLGVDTFWYGADFPGDTLQYLVIVRLPYGVPDRYHHAQCAAIGDGAQRRRIYLPRALAKFRQGFGRLMRRADDRGVVFLLDARVTAPRHRAFLKELPLASEWSGGEGLARLVRGDTDRCLREAFEHMGLEQRLREEGLWTSFADGQDLDAGREEAGPARREGPPRLDVSEDELPF